MFVSRPHVRRVAALALLCAATAAPARAQVDAIVTTPLGSFRIHLFEDEKPQTVANFLRYVREDRYSDSFFHRWVPGFILQAGGFNVQGRNSADPAFGSVDLFAPVVNEYGIGPRLPNRTGTVAMAKQSGDPDSATSQWFVNLSENQENLDNQNGGFTVFGALDDAAAFVSRINELDPENGPFLLDLGAPFSELPVLSRDTPGFSDLLYFEIRVERPGGRLTVSAQGDGLRIALHEALPEESYRLESSRDLRTWEAVETVTTNASGEATFPLQTPETASRVFLARPVID